MWINRFSTQGQVQMLSGNSLSSDFKLEIPCPYGKSGVMKSLLIGTLGLLLIPGVGLAADKAALKTETGKINYSVGYQIGGDFKVQGVELDPEALVQGIQDAIKQNKPKLTQDEMNSLLVGLKKKIMAEQQLKEKQAKADYRQASAAFLKENAKKEGVTVLPDGVQYKVLMAGNGKKPTLKDEVKVNFRVYRVDGKEIGNTYDSGIPRTMALSKALPGLREVLQLMPEGSKWQIVMPSTVASGGRDSMEDLGAVIYEMELISVIPAK